MTTEEDFQAMLDLDPNDHTTRLIFADWLQERDDPRASGYRALGGAGFVPYRVNSDRPQNWDGRMWLLGRSDNTGCAPQYRLCLVPVSAFILIPDQYRLVTCPTHWAHFASRRDAENAVALAYRA